MLALLLSRIEREFGPAIEHTQKVSRWILAPWLDLIVQQDVGVNFAHVWLTDTPAALALLPMSELVPADTGRHSNTYWRSMDRGRAAIRMRVTNELQLDFLIRALNVLRAGDQPKVANGSA